MNMLHNKRYVYQYLLLQSPLAPFWFALLRPSAVFEPSFAFWPQPSPLFPFYLFSPFFDTRNKDQLWLNVVIPTGQKKFMTNITDQLKKNI